MSERTATRGERLRNWLTSPERLDNLLNIAGGLYGVPARANLYDHTTGQWNRARDWVRPPNPVAGIRATAQNIGGLFGPGGMFNRDPYDNNRSMYPRDLADWQRAPEPDAPPAEAVPPQAAPRPPQPPAGGRDALPPGYANRPYNPREMGPHNFNPNMPIGPYNTTPYGQGIQPGATYWNNGNNPTVPVFTWDRNFNGNHNNTAGGSYGVLRSDGNGASSGATGTGGAGTGSGGGGGGGVPWYANQQVTGTRIRSRSS
jgi:hypothetical protein